MKCTFILVLLYFEIFSSSETEAISCIDENDKTADWYILYKLPKNSKSDNQFIKKGEGYASLNIKKGAWDLSQYSVEDEKSHFGRTYKQLLNNDLSYLLYNDQLPDSNASTSYWGHTKGIIATDGKTGYWFSHSIPRFPVAPDEDYYDYPDNAKDNGQSVICITFEAKLLPKIIKHVSFIMPNIYASHYTDDIKDQPEEVVNFFSGAPAFVKSAPWKSVDQISSEGGQKFKIFAKHGKWAQDLYNSSVSPELGSSLYVESWMSGRGNKLASDCDKKDPYTVLNVNSVKLQVGSQYVSFLRTQDHSKWAASREGLQKWVCIGDINRMESQFKRGGGTICIKSAKVWKAFHSSVDNYEQCPI